MEEQVALLTKFIKESWETLQQMYNCYDKLNIVSVGTEIAFRKQVLIDAGVRNPEIILDTIIKNIRDEDEMGTVSKTIFHPHYENNKLVIENRVIISTENLFFMTYSDVDNREEMVYTTLRHEMGHCLVNHILYDGCKTMSDVLIKRAHQISQRQVDVSAYNNKWINGPTTPDEEVKMQVDYYTMIHDELAANDAVGLTVEDMVDL